jgi:dipeptidyl aminopeptidase/acylaminoacyl peptidase
MKSPLTPSDLYSMIMLGDPQLAPAADSVYFRRFDLDREGDATRSAIWRVDADGRSAPFTSGRNDRLPRISPDGSTLAFVRDVDEKPRLHLIAAAGGEARAIGAAYDKITALSWSPDGTQLAFVAATEHEPATARIFADAPTGARHIRALPFKSDLDGLLDGTRRHLFVFDVKTSVKPSADPR